MKQKIIALLLALALTLSLCAVSALADGQSTVQDQPEVQDSTEADTGGEEAEEDAPASSPAGPDREPAADPETGALLETVTIVPDEMGTVSFANVERRMRENNLNVLALQENIDFIDSIDYDDLYEDLRKQLNSIAQQQWSLITTPTEYLGQIGMTEYSRDKTYDQLDAAYDAVREQFDAIKDGELQEDNAGVVRQLKNLQDQIIMAGEATYVALAAMELQEASLQRQLTAINRTVEEMELRYQLGQISALQLSQTKAGQTSLASGLETLRMNIRTYKAQLELLLGAEMTGEIQLGPVPAVTEAQIEEMDLEKDLAAAKEMSYELYDAAQTLADEEESYKDAGKEYGYNENKMAFRQAKHTWQAAQYTYNNTVQNYELRFRTLYAQVKDYQQIWNAAKVSLESQKLSAAASELKYQQGTISYNALLDARDELTAAEEKVQSAANDLFSAYNTYCWAVQHGILN